MDDGIVVFYADKQLNTFCPILIMKTCLLTCLILFSDQVDADEADELPDILPPKRKRRGKTAGTYF